MRDEPRDSYENLERSIDPDRVEEQRDATLEVVDRLRKRGIAVSEVEPPEALTDLLTAVEQFEMAVERHGGDLMVDDLDSSRPDDRHFVPPRRQPGEPLREYIGRVEAATMRLHDHPRRAD
ncbi:MAG TPA: hypothetical protein VF722_18510 [Gemmatimonadaceae bacterium]|jgi:hypothetical protein